MNNIQKVIEERLERFEKEFGREDNKVLGNIPILKTGILVKDAKSHISTTISNILTSVEKEVEGKKGTRFEEYEGVKSVDYGYESALNEVLELLKSSKENIK